MKLHPWWPGFGQGVDAADKLTSAMARAFATALARGTIPGVRLTELRRDDEYEAVSFEIDVERPQDLAYPIKATEPIAILFPLADAQPRVLALREDFPDTPHQNWTPAGAPCSLCIDDRPWAESKLTLTPADLAKRVQLWLAKAARGELHDPSQAVDPLFFRTGLSIVIPPSAFTTGDGALPEFIGFVRQDSPGVILTTRVPASGKASPQEARFIALSYRAAPQGMNRLRHAPTTLAGLHAELERCGVNLLKDIKACLTVWAGLKEDNLRRLISRLIIIVVFPVQEGTDRSINDLRAFVTHDTAGEIGVALGALLKHTTQVGAREAYAVAIGATAKSGQIQIDPAEVHFGLDRNLTAAVAGRAEVDRRRAVLVGAGALGSQIGLDLAREGALSWTVVDQDYLMPHNLARHALLAGDIGAPKALALARQMSALLDETCSAIRCDVTNPEADVAQKLAESLSAADIIIDASASVAVSRHLADLPAVNARRLCAFFNPSGTAAVLLAESVDRRITLRDLEAQYHGLLLSDTSLTDHLRANQPGLRYSGSCRALTNRIPATHTALLGALTARGISDCLGSDEAAIRIWTLSAEGEVRLVQRAGARVTTAMLASWSVSYDEGMLRALAGYRERRLPRETGGVLLGIIDVSRRSIHVAHALPQPEDSLGSVTGFERGVVGLSDAIGRVSESSLHQLRYVGEWHSHPRGSSAWPSHVDLAQLAWLGDELEAEGVPALMAIAADDGAFSLMIRDNTRTEEAETLRRSHTA